MIRTCLKIVAMGFLFILSHSCGSPEDAETLAANIESLLETVESDDCFESEGEGYVPETEDESFESSEALLLAECKAALVEAYDTDGNGEVDTEEEISSLNTDITERQAAKEELWEDEGLTAAQGKEKYKERRKLMREIALAECLDTHDENSDDVLSKDELKSCHVDRKTQRQDARRDLRCSNDASGECSPLAKAKIKTLFKEKRLQKVEARSKRLDTNKAAEEKGRKNRMKK